jgi:hypothetical protein
VSIEVYVVYCTTPGIPEYGQTIAAEVYRSRDLAEKRAAELTRVADEKLQPEDDSAAVEYVVAAAWLID